MVKYLLINNMEFKEKSKSGFTLIEMMVAVTIFTIVAMITSGAFISLTGVFQRIQTDRAVIDNINLAMDLMTLQIREGQNHNLTGGSCGTDCHTEISFDEYVAKNNQPEFNRSITYRLSNGRVEQCVSDQSVESNPSPSCSYLTSSEVEVNNLAFYHDPSNDNLIIVLVDGIAYDSRGNDTEFTLQSALSLRKQ